MDTEPQQVGGELSTYLLIKIISKTTGYRESYLELLYCITYRGEAVAQYLISLFQTLILIMIMSTKIITSVYLSTPGTIQSVS